MDTIARRAFFGVAGLGAVAAAATTSEGGLDEASEYGQLSRPIVVGVGRGQAASLTFVWLPVKGGQQRPPLKARLVIFDIGGKVLAQSDVVVAPFTGASVDFESPSAKQRVQVFGYVFLDDLQSVVGEIFGGVEVFDTSSGRTNIFAAPNALG